MWGAGLLGLTLRLPAPPACVCRPSLTWAVAHTPFDTPARSVCGSQLPPGRVSERTVEAALCGGRGGCWWVG